MEQQDQPPSHGHTAFKEGRYEVAELLGVGGQKRVYRAHDRSLDRDVAIAILAPTTLDATQLVRFNREARVTGRLGAHRNIVTIYDIWYEGEQPCIATELMPGGDLASLLKDAPGARLDWQRAVQIAEDICRALDHTHSLGVVHRDIKPENIWFAADGTPKLGDFGLAFVRDAGRVSEEGTFAGTIGYLAPEQAFGLPVLPQSDLYSLGTILYEMVAGRPPFVGDDRSSVLAQHVSSSPLAPSLFNREVPRVLDEIVLKLLAKRPEQRPESAAAVVRTLGLIRTTAVSGVTQRPLQDREDDPLSQSGFVGRREELHHLFSAFDNALSDRTGLRVLVGEAGIGKTRTSEELATYAGLRGALVLYGRCYEGRGAPAYWPWVQVLRSYAEARDPQVLLSQLGTRAAVIAQVAPTALKLPVLEPPPAVDPDQARFRFFESVGELIKIAAGEQALLLILEDIQWADAPSLLLLEFLAQDLRHTRVLIVATCRNTDLERSQPTAETLVKLSRESICDRIDLRGMPETDVGELLVSLGGKGVSPEFVRDIHRQTEGNPFFIEEMLRHLVDEGLIQREDGGWVGREALTSVGVPDSVRAVIGRRLSRLTESCRRILTIGAVIGREFSLGAVVAAAGRTHAEVLEHIEEAIRSSVVSKPADRRLDRYTFSHALIRECLYEELGSLQRARLHRQVGEGLEMLYGINLEPHVAELARHFSEAMQDGDATKAIEYSTQAAERANRLLAYEEAARHYEVALQALGLERPRSETRECRVLLALADTLWSAGETNTARGIFQRAAELARRLKDPQLLAAAALGAGGRYPGLQIGIFDESLVALLEEALTALEGTEAPPVPEIMARLAEALSFSPELQRRETLARTAMTLARRHGDPLELAKVLQHTHLPLWAPDNVDERLALSAEMLTLARETKSLGVSLAARGWRVVHLMEVGDIDEFRSEIEDYGRLADDLRQPVYQYVAHLRKTMHILLEGRYDEAEALAMHTIPLGQRAQIYTAGQAFGAQMYNIRMGQGRLGELELGVKGLIEQYPTMPGWRVALSLVYSQSDRRADARRELDRAVEQRFDNLQRDLNFNCVLALVSIAATYHNDASVAGLIYDLLLPHAQRCVLASGTAPLGSGSMFLGLLATILQRWDAADAHFQEALAMNTRLGARPWLAHTGLGYAEMLLARNQAGDVQKARDMLAESQPIADQLGLGSLTDRFRAARGRLAAASDH